MEIENQVIYSHDIWQYGEAQIGFSMIPEVIIETITNHYRTCINHVTEKHTTVSGNQKMTIEDVMPLFTLQCFEFCCGIWGLEFRNCSTQDYHIFLSFLYEYGVYFLIKINRLLMASADWSGLLKFVTLVKTYVSI